MGFLLLALKKPKIDGAFLCTCDPGFLEQGLTIAISCLLAQLSLLWGLRAQERYRAVFQGYRPKLYTVYVLRGSDAALGGTGKDYSYD